MNEYDEYQKLMRYKHGYHSFLIILFLSVFNYFFGIFGIQWAETKEIEMLVLLMIAGSYSVIMNTYRGAYFGKMDNPKIYSILFLLLGIFYMWSFFLGETNLIVDGKLTTEVITFSAGMVWVTIPITYLIRIIVERMREKNDD